MPCRDGGPSYSSDDGSKAKLKEAKKTIKTLSALLCSACKVLEAGKYDFGTNPELDVWWDEHKKEDAKREKAEAKKRLQAEEAAEIAKKPFKKLTNDDKKKLKAAGLL